MEKFNINELIDKYSKSVFDLAFRVTGSRSDAEKDRHYGFINPKG